MIRTLVRTSGFGRAVRRLTRRNRKLEDAIESTLVLLHNDAFDPRLATQKLSGDLAELWACSVSYDLRILFAFRTSGSAGEDIVLLSCGSHDDVY